MTKSSVRRILALAGLTVAIAAVPGSASAAVRTLSIDDPQGDASALSGPVLDLKSVAVRYDDAAGNLRVTWTYYNDIRINTTDGGMARGSFHAEAPVLPSVANDAVSIEWSWNQTGWDPPTWSASSSLYLSGSSGMMPGTTEVSQDGRVVTAEFSGPAMVGHDWQYTWGGTTISGDGYGDGIRQLWFDGYTQAPPTYPPAPGPLPPGHGGADANQGMTINGGALYTNDPDVRLSVIAPSWANSLRVANDGGFGAAKTFAVTKAIRWRLAESGRERLPKTVYLRFGSDAQTFTDDIILDQTKPTVSSATVGSGGATSSSAAVTATAASKRRTYRVRVRAKDATSGVAKVQFAVRSKRHPSALRKFKRISRYKGAAPKYVRVRDRAGNYSRWRSIR